MTNRATASVGVLAAALVVAAFAAVPHAGQTPAVAAKASSKWTVPKTQDGKPDFQGTWVNFDQTPFEQPLPQIAPDAVVAAPVPAGGGNGFGDQAAVVPRRPSMVVEPANGRVPVMPWAEKAREVKAAYIGDDWVNGTTGPLCDARHSWCDVSGRAYTTATGSCSRPATSRS